MAVLGAQQQITEAVLSWAGMSAEPHRFGGTEYRLGTREIGHIHGDHLVDIPFPTKVRAELVAAGAAEPHHLLKETGWVSFYLRQSTDIERAIALLQRSYELAVAQQQRRNQAAEG
jgi:predicted DNA-binding protein (MmcQ/YjbR family)